MPNTQDALPYYKIKAAKILSRDDFALVFSYFTGIRRTFVV